MLKKSIKKYRIYRINLKKDSQGGYVVTVPALPGCVTWGKNQHQALEMAEEAIEGFLEALAKEKEHLPEDRSLSKIRQALVQVSMPHAMI